MNPGTPFFDVFSHTPQCGRRTSRNRPAGCRSKRSKRIAMVAAPRIRGMEAVNTAKRSAAVGPAWHVASRAASGGAWASADAPPVRAATVSRMVLARRMPFFEHARGAWVAGRFAPMDLGEPRSYLTLEPGTDVYSSDGEIVGKVEHVLADEKDDIFDGIVIDLQVGPGGLHFADAP